MQPVGITSMRKGEGEYDNVSKMPWGITNDYVDDCLLNNILIYNKVIYNACIVILNIASYFLRGGIT